MKCIAKIEKLKPKSSGWKEVEIYKPLGIPKLLTGTILIKASFQT